MDATTFTAMRSDSGLCSGVTMLYTAKDMAVETVTTLATWTTLAVSQCFTKVRGRPQFDEEHQRSLLSCHTTDDDGFGSFPDDAAMLELRRRVQKADLPSTHTRPLSFAQELEATYNRHKAMHKSESTTEQTWGPPRPREKADATLLDNSDSLWSETDQALHEILHTKLDDQHFMHCSSDPGKTEDLRRLSVDELLALRMPSPTSTMSISEDSGEGRELRAWLETIDTSKASEFVAYARSFEQQGFLTLMDLAQLDEHDVEQAMSEIGISKFAHRARIRKAILRLPLDGAVPESQFVQPALAG